MTRLAKLQLIGPFVLAITIIAAEIAAYLLALKPSSAAAWYLNIEIFGIFQRSHYVLNNTFDVPYFQLLFVAIPMLMLSCLGVISRRQFLIAGASHFSFIYAFFIAYTWYIVGMPSLQAASLAQAQYSSVLSLSALNVSARPQVIVMLVLFFASLLSFAGSQIHYARAVRQT